MSHLEERQEKNCLNCNTEVQGRFCQNCGQENIETKETVWHLISHFFQDITHFDGKFFGTLKYLFTRPGFLSKEYMIGRRASYVNPVRMYVFTSAFFFLVFFSIFKVDKNTIIKDVPKNGKTYLQIEAMDSLAFDAFTKNINKEDDKDTLPMSRGEFKKYFDSTSTKGSVHFAISNYETRVQYDSAQSTTTDKDNWLMRQLTYKQIEISQKYKDEGGRAITEYLNILLHSLPQMFFILLPLFALILKLLYRRRKEYYYVNHSIFSIHFYIFTFISMLILFGLDKLNKELHWSFIKYFEVVLGLGILFYLYKSMRKFYGQRRAKTVFKFLILCFSLWITVLLLFFVFILYSLYKL